jgi:hypothetical protein
MAEGFGAGLDSQRRGGGLVAFEQQAQTGFGDIRRHRRPYPAWRPQPGVSEPDFDGANTAVARHRRLVPQAPAALQAAQGPTELIAILQHLAAGGPGQRGERRELWLEENRLLGGAPHAGQRAGDPAVGGEHLRGGEDRGGERGRRRRGALSLAPGKQLEIACRYLDLRAGDQKQGVGQVALTLRQEGDQPIVLAPQLIGRLRRRVAQVTAGLTGKVGEVDFQQHGLAGRRQQVPRLGICDHDLDRSEAGQRFRRFRKRDRRAAHGLRRRRIPIDIDNDIPIVRTTCGSRVERRRLGPRGRSGWNGWNGWSQGLELHHSANLPVLHHPQ